MRGILAQRGQVQMDMSVTGLDGLVAGVMCGAAARLILLDTVRTSAAWSCCATSRATRTSPRFR